MGQRQGVKGRQPRSQGPFSNSRKYSSTIVTRVNSSLDILLVSRSCCAVTSAATAALLSQYGARKSGRPNDGLTSVRSRVVFSLFRLLVLGFSCFFAGLLALLFSFFYVIREFDIEDEPKQ